MRLLNPRFLWIPFLLLIFPAFLGNDLVLPFLSSNVTPQSLDFNRREEQRLPTKIVSPDEQINMDVFKKVHPSVVNIATTTLRMNFWMEIIPREGQGSGFFIDRRGYILTNNHVVANVRDITVTTARGEKTAARLVGRAPAFDLAVIKVPAEYVDAVAELGDSDRIQVGQKAIAIGNPFGLSLTLTTGVVSALDRSIRTADDNQIDDLIQTDAAINPGNSGGPLLNSDGRVIGINTAIFSVSGGYEGIGFAIPVNTAKYVATELITKGRVVKPWLGITGISLSPGLSKALGFKVQQGVLIVDVVPGSPAARAGLHGGDREVVVGGVRIRLGGDVVQSMEGRSVSTMKELVQRLMRMRAGQTIALGIVRDQEPMELKVHLAERPSE